MICRSGWRGVRPGGPCEESLEPRRCCSPWWRCGWTRAGAWIVVVVVVVGAGGAPEFYSWNWRRVPEFLHAGNSQYSWPFPALNVCWIRPVRTTAPGLTCRQKKNPDESSCKLCRLRRGTAPWPPALVPPVVVALFPAWTTCVDLGSHGGGENGAVVCNPRPVPDPTGCRSVLIVGGGVLLCSGRCVRPWI